MRTRLIRYIVALLLWIVAFVFIYEGDTRKGGFIMAIAAIASINAFD